jgi:hypothetical protein
MMMMNLALLLCFDLLLTFSLDVVLMLWCGPFIMLPVLWVFWMWLFCSSIFLHYGMSLENLVFGDCVVVV